jgi:hypothetical protein
MSCPKKVEYATSTKPVSFTYPNSLMKTLAGVIDGISLGPVDG